MGKRLTCLGINPRHFAVQTLTFPNNQTPLGRFLKCALEEQISLSGTAYSWASDPSADPCQYMILDAGLPQPDLVVCMETSFFYVLSRGGIAPSLFVDIDFQQKLRTCYADPRIWKGINVVVHETQMNRWASRKTLIRRIQGELLLRSQPKHWVLSVGTE